MRIAIDARKLRDYGIGTYVRNLLRQLARTDQQTEYVLLCRAWDLELLGDLGPNFRLVPESSPGLVSIHVPRMAWRSWATEVPGAGGWAEGPGG